MAARRARLNGFTLVEILIAVTILAMVIGIATYGYSLFSRDWSSRLGRFSSAQGELQRLDLVIRSLEDTLPFVVRDPAGEPGFYFLGRDEGLTLVTASPVFGESKLAVIRLFREPAGDGRWNLVYEEAPLRGAEALRVSTQQLPFQDRMIVLRDLRRLEFAYFGWESPDARVLAADQPESGLAARWWSAYDGLVRRQHPQRIALRLDGGEAVVFVSERADIAFRRFADQD
jgi:prepilin-type N-terminal cleavage/methylation domain-containing protein